MAISLLKTAGEVSEILRFPLNPSILENFESQN